MSKKLIYILLSVVFFNFTISIEAKETPQLSLEIESIVKGREKCIASDPGLASGYTTPGLTKCEWDAYKKFDEMLNEVYQKLKSKLTREEKQQLVNSQKRWIQYRNTEFQLIEAIYSKLGTIGKLNKIYRQSEIVRHRLEELQVYLKEIEVA